MTKQLVFLETQQLEKLSTQRLLNVLKSARAVKCSIIKNHVCECCGEFIYSTEEAYEKEVAPFRKYYEKIKTMLATREHVQKGVVNA